MIMTQAAITPGVTTHSTHASNIGAITRSQWIMAAAAIAGANGLLDKLQSVLPQSPAADSLFSLAGSINVFQLLAWLVAFGLLRQASSQQSGAHFKDQLIAFVFVTGILLANFLSQPFLFAVLVSSGAIFIASTSPRRSPARAAGMIFFAMAVNAIWGPAFFALAAGAFLQADELITRAAIHALFPQISWANNVITAPDSHRIVLLDGCASFHNMSLALLCWTAVTMHARPYFVWRDMATAAIACISMYLLNAGRIALMAQGREMYVYWHDGHGKDIFAIAVTLTIAAICLAGCREAKRIR